MRYGPPRYIFVTLAVLCAGWSLAALFLAAWVTSGLAFMLTVLFTVIALEAPGG